MNLYSLQLLPAKESTKGKILRWKFSIVMLQNKALVTVGWHYLTWYNYMQNLAAGKSVSVCCSSPSTPWWTLRNLSLNRVTMIASWQVPLVSTYQKYIYIFPQTLMICLRWLRLWVTLLKIWSGSGAGLSNPDKVWSWVRWKDWWLQDGNVGKIRS